MLVVVVSQKIVVAISNSFFVVLGQRNQRGSYPVGHGVISICPYIRSFTPPPSRASEGLRGPPRTSDTLRRASECFLGAQKRLKGSQGPSEALRGPQ